MPNSKKLDELIKQALSECWRANKDQIKSETNCQKLAGLPDLLDSLDTTDVWDDLTWHAGYIRGLEEAKFYLQQK